MIQIASPLYTVGDWNGNATDDQGVDWVVTGEDGWSSSPPVRPTQEDRLAADGAWSGPGYYGARVVSLTGKAIAADQLSMLAAKDRIKAAINPREPVMLQVDEAHLSRFAWVRLSDQIVITDSGTLAFDWSLIVVAADPRRYSTETESPTTGLPSTTTTGRTYPRTYPYTFGGGASGGSGSVYIDNQGDYDATPAVATITGPIINPQIAHVQTGRSLTFALTLAEGERLIVDLLERTALLNGMASRTSTLSTGSAWFMLVPGTNEIQFRGQDPGTGTTTPSMTITAASAWT